MEKIFNTQDKCADFVRHFSLHMLYFFHILPVISSLADILLLLSFSDGIKFFHFTEWPKDAYNSIFGSLCVILWPLDIGKTSETYTSDLSHRSVGKPLLFSIYLFSFLRTTIFKNHLCFCYVMMPVEKQKIWRKDHVKLLKNRSFCPVECNGCYWIKIAGQNLALPTCVIDIPSSLLAVWETDQSAESAAHCPWISLGWRIFQDSSQVVPQLRAMITLSQPMQGAFLASSSDEALHLLPCYEQRCCCDRCLRSRGMENVRESAPEEKLALSSEWVLWLP